MRNNKNPSKSELTKRKKCILNTFMWLAFALRFRDLDNIFLWFVYGCCICNFVPSPHAYLYLLLFLSVYHCILKFEAHIFGEWFCVYVYPYVYIMLVCDVWTMIAWVRWNIKLFTKHKTIFKIDGKIWLMKKRTWSLTKKKTNQIKKLFSVLFFFLYYSKRSNMNRNQRAIIT